MALVNCPECGKENVSDSAVSCPDCGYAIKSYYDKLKQNEILKEQEAQLEEKVKAEAEKLKTELDRKICEVEKMPYPEKPTFIQELFHSKGGGNGLIYATIIALIVSLLLGYVAKFFIVIFSLLLVLWVPFLLFICYGDYKCAISQYEIKTRIAISS